MRHPVDLVDLLKKDYQNQIVRWVIVPNYSLIVFDKKV